MAGGADVRLRQVAATEEISTVEAVPAMAETMSVVLIAAAAGSDDSVEERPGRPRGPTRSSSSTPEPSRRARDDLVYRRGPRSHASPKIEK